MIKVLIGDSSERIRDNLKRRLDAETTVGVCALVGGGEEAVQESLRVRPDVAVVDSALPGLDGLQVTEMLAQFAPGTGVILTALESENDLMRRAMLAGAREVLQKPFSGDELVSAIQRVHDFQERKRKSGAATTPATPGNGNGHGGGDHGSPQGILVTVLAGKGGIGKSVVATNLAVALTQRGDSRVALVDLSLQFGDVAALLDVTQPRTIADLAAHNAVADADVVADVLSTTATGLHVLPAPASPELADYVTTQHLRALLDELRRSHEIVVADTNTQLGEVTLEAVESSERIVLLTDYSVTGVKNTRLVMSVLGVLKVPDDKVLLVANNRDARTENALARTQAESFLGSKIALEIPFDPAVVGAAVSRGAPVMTTAPESGVTAAIKRLADLIAQGGPTAPAGMVPSPAPAAKRQRRILGFAR
jgi:pilus assembly protein CpaE